ncbi:hypothetical protein FRX31_034042 [Thalictrum thalictroides]|uniref:Uncharacterized protein n=1 Tax=Thalictrum thalictroides TaxID=46969 RepID=A0A7J6UW06_THATH|nr:hypothetical protein FRX31_034042 [Thalictrum thalictroides]
MEAMQCTQRGPMKIPSRPWRNIPMQSIKETQHSQLKSDEGQSGENELFPFKGKEYILVVNSDIVAATIDPLQEASEFSNTRLGGFVAWEHFHRGMVILLKLHIVGFREFGINKVAMDL